MRSRGVCERRVYSSSRASGLSKPYFIEFLKIKIQDRMIRNNFQFFFFSTSAFKPHTIQYALVQLVVLFAAPASKQASKQKQAKAREKKKERSKEDKVATSNNVARSQTTLYSLTNHPTTYYEEWYRNGQ